MLGLPEPARSGEPVSPKARVEQLLVDRAACPDPGAAVSCDTHAPDAGCSGNGDHATGDTPLVVHVVMRVEVRDRETGSADSVYLCA